MSPGHGIFMAPGAALLRAATAARHRSQPMNANPQSRPLAGREDPAPQPDPRRDREPAEEEEE